MPSGLIDQACQGMEGALKKGLKRKTWLRAPVKMVVRIGHLRFQGRAFRYDSSGPKSKHVTEFYLGAKSLENEVSTFMLVDIVMMFLTLFSIAENGS